MNLEAPLVALLELPTATLRVPVMLVLCAMSSNKARRQLKEAKGEKGQRGTGKGDLRSRLRVAVKASCQASCQVLMNSDKPGAHSGVEGPLERRSVPGASRSKTI